MNFTLEKLGLRRPDGRLDIRERLVHVAPDLDAAINSAKRIVQTTFNVTNVAGFRLLNNDGTNFPSLYMTIQAA
ncbi:MAG: hypothetical protein ACR2KT_00710 [Methylocella sp.]